MENLNQKDQKWWYSFDSLGIFDEDEDREEDKIIKHSFKQLKEFYDKTVKESYPIDI